MRRSPRYLWLTRQIWREARSHPRKLARTRELRFRELVAFARERSPVYREKYRHLSDPPSLADVPPVTKAELTERFDRWITDPDITIQDVEAHMEDVGRIGRLLRERYLVCKTSGSTGRSAILLHDRPALTIYHAMWAVRGYWSRFSLRDAWPLIHTGGRSASVLAFTDHYGGPGWQRYAMGEGEKALNLSIQLPRPELVSRLNAFQPAILIAYASWLDTLAREQLAGKLNIRPLIAISSGEDLTPDARERVREAFRSKMENCYAASECPTMAFDCGRERLHLNLDWAIVEPVDEELRPVPPGETSHSVLVTNLANRAQPVIRYVMEDRITIDPEPCGCSLRLPAVDVKGRREELLEFESPSKSVVAMPGITLQERVESVPGVLVYQVLQTAPDEVVVRLAAEDMARDASVWERVRENLDSLMKQEGLPNVRVERDPEGPRPDPITGKFHGVWSEWKRRKPPASTP